MAMSSLRLRRALTTASTSTSTLRRLAGASSVVSPPAPHSPSTYFHRDSSVQSQSRRYAVSPYILFQSRAFRASPASLLSARGGGGGGGDLDEIGPDTILFEGCDYNHWLIVMDFKDSDKKTPEEMVRTYEETCARGLNISVEEAKLKMYACSTTTYTGFQAVMTEEESERFNGLPGVIFVLPDSYIDPQNKEYGGDKYMNGTIIPRPPPIEYRRSTGRYRDQPKFDSRPPPPSQQPNQSFNQQQYRPPQQNYPPPQQQYGPPGSRAPYQQGPPGGGDPYQHGPPGGGSPYQQGPPGGGSPYQQGPPGGRGPYQQGPPGGRGPYQQGPPGGGSPYQPGPPGGGSPYQQGPPPQYQGNFNNSGGQGNYYPQDQRNYERPPPPNQQGSGGFSDDYGNYGQGGPGGHQGPGGFRRN